MPGSHERERALVVAAAAGVLDACWPVREGLAGVDWGWIVPRLDEVALGGRFWAEASRAGVVERLPPGVRDRLRSAAEETAVRSAQHVAAALRVGAALDAAGLPWIAMKGVALALVAPEYGPMRHVSDVDLLVPPDELARAAEVLSRDLALVHEVRDYDGAPRDADAAMRDGVHHLYVFRAADGAMVELHHALPSLPSREVTEGFFARATPLVVRGRRVLAPALDDLLGSACVHALVHHASERRIALRHLADVAELLARGASVERACARYDRDGRTSVAASVRDLAEAREDARVRGGPPSGASLALEPGRTGRLRDWAARVGGQGRQIVAGLRAFGGGAVLPPRSFMVGKYGPAADGPLLPYFHLRRIASVLLRLVRGGR